MPKKLKLIFWLVIFVLAAAPRLLNLDAFLSPDEPQWERNTLGFVSGLKQHDTRLLYQQAHPGITTMWLAAPVISNPSWAIKRLPQAIFLTLTVLAIVYLTSLVFGDAAGIMAGILIALDPLLIANTRILAMDALLATFIALALLAYLAWKKTDRTYLLIAAGACSALAVLSKVSGILIVAYLGLFLLWDVFRRPRTAWRPLAIYGAAAVFTTILVFPTIALHTAEVWQGTRDFFTTENYSQTVHALGPAWYPQALTIWSTPLEMLALIVVFGMWTTKPLTRRAWLSVLFFAVLFFLAMQYSIKKGDRYILPVFMLLELLSAVTLIVAYRSLSKRYRFILASVAVVALGWQLYTTWQLHPYVLAYRNPFFRQVAVGRTMGWGEGLDLAATYLNQKPNADTMLVAAYYEGEFGYKFHGQVTSAERLGNESLTSVHPDYVVLYRTMQGRAPERWETKVLAQFQTVTPEHIIYLNGEPYVWIYKTSPL